ncbi:hypothetical protein A3K73_00825 [Candidatus Pacearchaeota archaeon RBG_13_36_9]|nr:MAG: hypothetical protein A3K73_00825 [Candidatus Pacearchaeota archaeon RBG_13_36_9]
MVCIDNLTFFRIADKLVRESMQKVETEIIPFAEQALKETGLKLQEHPIEGYYGATKELAHYFNILKTLQLNHSDRAGKGVEKLHKFYTNKVFGFGQAVRTALNSEGVWYPEEPPAVISPMVDPLTCAVLRVGSNPVTAHQDLTIENIAKILENMELGRGLVGFGSLVDKVERGTGRYNPIATTLSRETTVLSAYVPSIGCALQNLYSVSPKVEEQGNIVVESYNSLFREAGSNVRITNITEKNAFCLNDNLSDMDRCVRIFNLIGREQEFYHWAICGREVIDFWRKEVVTTNMFKENPAQYRNNRNS